MILCIFKIWCETALNKLYKKPGSPSWVLHCRVLVGIRSRLLSTGPTSCALATSRWPHIPGFGSQCRAVGTGHKAMELSTEVQLCVCECHSQVLGLETDRDQRSAPNVLWHWLLHTRELGRDVTPDSAHVAAVSQPWQPSVKLFP